MWTSDGAKSILDFLEVSSLFSRVAFASTNSECFLVRVVLKSNGDMVFLFKCKWLDVSKKLRCSDSGDFPSNTLATICGSLSVCKYVASPFLRELLKQPRAKTSADDGADVPCDMHASLAVKKSGCVLCVHAVII